MTSSVFLRRIAAAAAMLLASVSASAQAIATALATLHPRNSAELSITKQLREGKFHLRTSDPTPVSQAFLQEIFHLPAMPSLGSRIEFEGYHFAQVTASGQKDANIRIIFSQAEFEGGAQFQGNFGASLEFLDCRLHDALVFKDVQITGSLIFSGLSFEQRSSDRRTVQLENVTADGDILFLTSNAALSPTTKLAVLHTKARSLEVQAPNSVPTTIDLPDNTLESARLSLAPNADNTSVNLSGTTIARSLDLVGQIQALYMDRTSVGGQARIVAGPQRVLELNYASFNTLLYEPAETNTAPPKPLIPAQLQISNITFNQLLFAEEEKNLTVDHDDTFHGSAAQKPRVDYGTSFFERADYFQPAFARYQTQLENAGQTSEAAHINWLMHRHGRDMELEGHTASGYGSYLVDWMQQVLFGYGRTLWVPALWCLLFVLCGWLLFHSTEVVEPVENDKPTPIYSGFWYSLELFLPVVELGVAKHWRLINSERKRQIYARVHQLAGWVLIPVILGILTGSLK